MIRIMLVDDEYLFREALKATMPWNEMGYEVCCEAENGFDALEKLQEYDPQVVLVDINMPVLDGLDFAAEVFGKGYNLKMIIITGYGEFQYARKALQLGVENYLLKPVEEKELSTILLKIKEDLEHENAVKLEMDGLKKQADEYRLFQEEKYICNLLLGYKRFSWQEAEKYTGIAHISELCKLIRVIAMEIDEKAGGEAYSSQKEFLKVLLSNTLEKHFKMTIGSYLIYDVEGRLCLIAGWDESDDLYFTEHIGLELEKIRIYASRYLGFTVSAGIGNSYEKLEDIPASYAEAVDALKSNLIPGGDKVILFSEIARNKIYVSLLPLEQRRQLLIYMRTRDMDGVLTTIGNVFSEAKKRSVPRELITSVCFELLSVCFEYTSEMSSNISSLLGKNGNFMDLILSKKTLEELEQIITDFYSQVIEATENNKERKPDSIIDKVNAYILQNISNHNLNIDDIANHVYLNYKYLCFMFKRKTGMTLNEYITTVRMNKAKELMDDGKISSTLIAGKVGYADANYFSKCFKKYFGVAPTEYMRNISGKLAGENKL